MQTLMIKPTLQHEQYFKTKGHEINQNKKLTKPTTLKMSLTKKWGD
jgi:hypothetical protein